MTAGCFAPGADRPPERPDRALRPCQTASVISSPATGAPRSLADLVRRAAAATPDRTAFVGPAGSVTWGALDRTVDDTASGLLALGLSPGDRVGIALGNVLDVPAVYFGVLRAGLVAVPLNTGYPPAEAGRLLQDCSARALVTAPEAGAAGLLDERPADLAHVVVAGGSGPGSLAALQAAGGPAPSVERGGEDVAVLLYTSGTSGRPKGAMLSHRALLANLDQAAGVEPPVVTGEDVVLLVMPLFHVYGLNTGLGMVARQGATGVLVERFDPVGTLEQVRAQGVTCVVGAPPMYVAWSQLPDLAGGLAGLRLALSGAAPLPRPVLERILAETGRRVHEGYGLTEAAPALTTTLCSPRDGTGERVLRPGSVGRPLPGIELELRDDAGKVVEDGDPGEITVRGANLFSGYWPDGADGPDAEGWFATGDIAYADAAGDLFLVDRLRELILVSGFNVYPREVEDVLLTHPSVAEAAVLGVPHPYTGEAVRALVVPHPGATVDPDELVAHAARLLARFKCPSSVEVVDALPHSATGKVSKGRLRDRAG